MSDDTYPRVSKGNDPSGPHKVVPSDAIVIERGDLPEIERLQPRSAVIGGSVYALDLSYAEAEARAWIAVVEYLRTNPPVDEAEVERLERLITQQPGWSVGSDRLARDLYLAGVRAPEVTE